MTASHPDVAWTTAARDDPIQRTTARSGLRSRLRPGRRPGSGSRLRGAIPSSARARRTGRRSGCAGPGRETCASISEAVRGLVHHRSRRRSRHRHDHRQRGTTEASRQIRPRGWPRASSKPEVGRREREQAQHGRERRREDRRGQAKPTPGWRRSEAQIVIEAPVRNRGAGVSVVRRVMGVPFAWDRFGPENRVSRQAMRRSGWRGSFRARSGFPPGHQGEPGPDFVAPEPVVVRRAWSRRDDELPGLGLASGRCEPEAVGELLGGTAGGV